MGIKFIQLRTHHSYNRCFQSGDAHPAGPPVSLGVPCAASRRPCPLPTPPQVCGPSLGSGERPRIIPFGQDHLTLSFLSGCGEMDACPAGASALGRRTTIGRERRAHKSPVIAGLAPGQPSRKRLNMGQVWPRISKVLRSLGEGMPGSSCRFKLFWN